MIEAHTMTDVPTTEASPSIDDLIEQRRCNALENMSRLSSPVSVSVVIPAYNESGRISSLGSKIEDLKAVHDASDGLIVPNLIVIDEGSTDNTFEVATEYPVDPVVGLQVTRIPDSLLSYRRANENQKLVQMGAAIATGLEAVTQARVGDYIVYTDFDNSVPLWELGNALPYMLNGTDLLIGSRRKPGSVVVRNPQVAQYGSQYIKVWSDLFPDVAKVTDDTNGAFHVWRHDRVLPVVEQIHRHKAYSPAVKTLYIHWALELGYKVDSMGITFQDVSEGSKFAGDNADGRLGVYVRLVRHMLPHSNNSSLVRTIDGMSDNQLREFVSSYGKN